MTTKLSYQPVLRLSIQANENIPAFKFINLNGGLCTSSQRALGVSDYAALSGEMISVITLGTAIVRASGNIVKGDVVSADSSGNAKQQSSGEIPQGIAISNKLGDFVEVLLIH